MKLAAIVDSLDLRLRSQHSDLSCEVTGAYVSDLLSDVLAYAKEGNVWITLQGHPNIVAVASMKEIAGIIIVNGRLPEENAIIQADNEAIPIMTSDKQTFELAGRLYALLEES